MHVLMHMCWEGAMDSPAVLSWQACTDETLQLPKLSTHELIGHA